MPEGPSIVLLKEAVEKFTGKKIIEAVGNTQTIDKELLPGKKVKAFKSWGKHFLICLPEFTVKIHFMLFGSFTVDEEKEPPRAVRLKLKFRNGEINFYACSVRMIGADLDAIYNWSADVLNDAWDPQKARKKLKAQPELMICDALLEQEIFGGVGNIIKNEVLYRVKVHPESLTGKIPARKLGEIIKEARNYSFDFLEWKRNYVLRKHWLAHTKTVCMQCGGKIFKKYTGLKKRRSFFCTNCQKLYE
jgi:endonuclease-8